MKKRGGGKGKGSAFERWVARELSKWLTGGEDSKQLIRSVLSGGWMRGRQGGEGWRQAGDLSPNGPKGEEFRAAFAVECKHRRDIDLYGLWTRQADIRLWWKKLGEEALEAGVEPLLVFRANQRPTMTAMSYRVFDHIQAHPLSHGGDLLPVPLPAARFNLPALVLLPFETLVQLPPAVLLSIRQSK
jgi:hypothetical protein